MKIAIASDHAGFEHKQIIAQWLKENNYDITDYGCWSAESVDYPDFAFSAAVAVAEHKADYGLIICGTGIGVNITANKVDGIRAANCCSVEMARLAREHNNANVLNFGARLIDVETAKEIVTVFLNTDFEASRHQIRVDKIHTLTKK